MPQLVQHERPGVGVLEAGGTRLDLARRTAVPFSEWHTYTIEWKPDEIVFSIDGVTIGTTRSDIPTATMHWVMQIETSKKRPPEGAAGAVQIDWAAIYRYDG